MATDETAGTKKYEELFALTKEGLTEEIDRFKRVDDKASRYLSIVSILMVIFGFGFRPIVELSGGTSGFSFWILVTIAFCFLFSTVLAIWLLFSTLKIQALLKFPMTLDLLPFFQKNTYLDIISALSRENIKATLQNRVSTDRKTQALTKAYRLMMTAILLLAGLVFWIIVLALMSKFNLEF